MRSMQETAGVMESITVLVEETEEVTEEKEGSVEESEEDKEGNDQKLKAPRYMTIDRCGKDDIVMWCRFCDWVKPIPKIYDPTQYVTGGGNQYVCYQYQTPTSFFKKSNAYKRTVEHMWKCPRRNGRGKSDFGYFFSRTYGGEPVKGKRREGDKMKDPLDEQRSPRPPNRGMMGKHTTLATCKRFEVVLRCSKCDYVKRWPTRDNDKKKALEGLKLARGSDKRGPKLVILDQSPTSQMRKTAQWKKMRAHFLKRHAGEVIPELYA